MIDANFAVILWFLVTLSVSYVKYRLYHRLNLSNVS